MDRTWLFVGAGVLVVLFFLLWARRKPNRKKRHTKRGDASPKSNLAPGEGKVVVTRNLKAARHAWLKPADRDGKIFVHYDVVERSGIQDLEANQIYHARWQKSRRKRGRLDVVEFRKA